MSIPPTSRALSDADLNEKLSYPEEIKRLKSLVDDFFDEKGFFKKPEVTIEEPLEKEALKPQTPLPKAFKVEVTPQGAREPQTPTENVVKGRLESVIPQIYQMLQENTALRASTCQKFSKR